MGVAQPRMVTVCRRISFSSGHRYFRPDWGEEENRRIYGSSYSAYGHGHNFVLEAHVEGPIDPQTGMVVNLKDVDVAMGKVVEPLDHHFLNTDVPHFGTVVPTTENIAAYCFEQLRGLLDGDGRRLRKVRLYEGADLWVDYEGRM
jgi:6-pyruvoyltetrahydropterin/6-carboxytetrahydropterin synthase